MYRKTGVPSSAGHPRDAIHCAAARRQSSGGSRHLVQKTVDLADAVAVELCHVKADYERLARVGCGQMPMKSQRVVMGVDSARNREYVPRKHLLNGCNGGVDTIPALHVNHRIGVFGVLHKSVLE